MTNKDLEKALIELGFSYGWVLQGGEIVVWEHTEKQPTKTQLDAALIIALQTETTTQAAKVLARQAVLDKLGLTADEAAALLG